MRSLLLIALLLLVSAPAYAQPTSGGVASGIAGGTPLSAGTVTATGGSAARTTAAIAADSFNVLSFTGADPSGSSSADNSVAINAAAVAARNGTIANVYLPAGVYHVKHAITLGSTTASQCLVGDGSGSIIDVGSDFDSSASGVVVITTGNAYGTQPCVRNIQFLFHQPADVITTTTAGQTAGNATITVASATGIVNGMTLVDTTTNAAIPSPVYGTTSTLPTVTISGTTVTISANIASPGVGSGDTIHFASSRAQFKTLAAGCTTTTGGSGCKYPWAIYNNGAQQIYLDNVLVSGAWDGVYQRGQTFHIGTLFVGAYDIGLDIDNCHNFPQIDDYEFWNFGIDQNVSQKALSAAYYDGTTVAANIGAIDGGAITSIQTWDGIVNLTANWTLGSIDQINLDGTSAALNILATKSDGNVQIGQIYSVRGGSAVQPAITVNTNAGFYSAVEDVFLRSDYAGGFNLDLENGILNIGKGLFYKNAPGANPFIKQNGGSLFITNSHFNGNSASAGTYISQTAGAIRLANSSFDSTSGTTSAASLTDNALNSVTGNSFNSWAFQAPGPLGNYNPNTGNGQGGWITYSPTIHAWLSGTLTAYTINSASYQTTGMNTCVNVKATITTVGTANSIRVDLPNTSAQDFYIPATVNSGLADASVNSGQTQMFVINTSGTAWAPSSGNFVNIAGCYPNQ